MLNLISGYIVTSVLTGLGQIKNKCVSGSGSENFRLGRHKHFLILFWKRNMILCILKVILPLIIFFPENLIFFLGFTSNFQ